jgi:hypothetical protein
VALREPAFGGRGCPAQVLGFLVPEACNSLYIEAARCAPGSGFAAVLLLYGVGTSAHPTLRRRSRRIRVLRYLLFTAVLQNRAAIGGAP